MSTEREYTAEDLEFQADSDIGAPLSPATKSMLHFAARLLREKERNAAALARKAEPVGHVSKEWDPPITVPFIVYSDARLKPGDELYTHPAAENTSAADDGTPVAP